MQDAFRDRGWSGEGDQDECQAILKTVAALATSALAFAGLAGSAAAQTSRLDEIVKRDKLIVATFGTAPPFCFADDKGQLVGFDIDIAKLIAKYLLGDEKKIEFMTVTSEGRWPAVNSGRADFGIASTTIYPDRALRVAFTRPYIDSGISVLVRKDANIDSVAALNDAKFTLANLSNPQMIDRQKRFMPNVKVLDLRHAERHVPRRQERPSAGHADGFAGDRLVRREQQRAEDAAREPGQHPGQRDLHEAGRLHALALPRHRRGRARRRLALQRLHRRLQEVVRPQPAAAALLRVRGRSNRLRGGPRPARPSAFFAPVQLQDRSCRPRSR